MAPFYDARLFRMSTIWLQGCRKGAHRSFGRILAGFGRSSCIALALVSLGCAPRALVLPARITNGAAIERILTDLESVNEPSIGELFSLNEATSTLRKLEASDAVRLADSLAIRTYSEFYTRAILEQRHGPPDVEGTFVRPGEPALTLLRYGWFFVAVSADGKMHYIGHVQRTAQDAGYMGIDGIVTRKTGTPEVH
jgi:hypothetical protein